MTIKQIEKQREAEMKKVNLKFDTAAKIRAILEEARKEYGAQDWDDEDMESAVIELVTSES